MIENAAVIGGGIGGLATAIALRQVGIKATVFERAEAIREVGAGLSLWPNATRALDSLGVLGELRPHAAVIDRLIIRAPNGNALLSARTHLEPTPALGASRHALVAALMSQLPPDCIQLGRELKGLTQDASGIRLHFTSGQDAGFDIAVGADGIRSRVRSIIAKENVPVPQSYEVFRGVTPVPGYDAQGDFFESWGNGTRFGLMDIGGGNHYWYATVPTGSIHPGSSASCVHSFLQETFSSWHGPIPTVLQATKPAEILRGVPLHRPPRQGWSLGRAVLLGDAAHPTTPNLGQGAALALEDSVALASSLRAHHEPAKAFAKFEAARFDRTAKIIRQSERIGQNSGLAGPQTFARNLTMRTFPNTLYEQHLRSLFRG